MAPLQAKRHEIAEALANRPGDGRVVKVASGTARGPGQVPGSRSVEWWPGRHCGQQGAESRQKAGAPG